MFKVFFYSDILKSVSFNWTNILSKIQVYHTNEEWTIVSSNKINWAQGPEFPSCQTLDILQYFNFTAAAPRQIFFNFNKVENIGVSLYVEDRSKALRRPLKGR